MGIYMDDCKFGQSALQDKILGIFVSLPLWRPKSTRNSGWLIWACRMSLLSGNTSIYPVLQSITWQCNVLFYGVKPQTLMNGDPVPLSMKYLLPAGTSITKDHLCFTVSELRADWKQHREVWNFISSWIATNICFKCWAKQNRVRCSYLDCTDNAEWLETELGLAEFIADMLKPRADGQYCF